MAPAKKGANKKASARMRRLREIRRRKREESKTQITKEQVAILLRTLSEHGIVQE